MSKRQNIRAAIGEGIDDVGLNDELSGRALEGFSSIATTSLKDLQGVIRNSSNGISVVSDMSYICAGTLAHSSLKLPEGKFQSSQNAQLMREVLSKLLRTDYQLDVSVALGGSEDPPSLRLPSYVLPALDIAQLFVDRQASPPNVRIFNAHEVSSSLNGLNPIVAQHRAKQAEELLNGFTNHYFPHLSGVVQFEEVNIEEMRDRGLEADAEHLREILGAEVSSLSPEQLFVQRALQKLLSNSQKHSNNGDSAKIVCGYAAAHGLSYRNYGSDKTEGVIKIGGKGEAPFDLIQAYLTKQHELAGDKSVTNLDVAGTSQLICLRNKAGVLPPYYLEGAGELTVESKPDDIPLEVSNITSMYKRNGLRTGLDFLHLPAHIQVGLGQFLRGHVSLHSEPYRTAVAL